MARPKRNANASAQRIDAVKSAEGIATDTGSGVVSETVVSRPTQNPVIIERNKLVVRGLDNENFYYRWCIDKDDNIAIRMEEGYVLVPKKGMQAGDRDVNYSQSTASYMTRSAGFGSTLYLMKIPRELWLARQAALSQKDAAERELYIKEKVKSEKGLRGSINITRK